MAEIKPCPFCGNKAEYWLDSQYSNRHVIECINCGAEKRSEYGYNDVLRDWNRRFDGSGKEVIEIEVVKYRPGVSVRVPEDSKRGFMDVVVWKGDDVVNTNEEAFAIAKSIIPRLILNPQAEQVLEITHE